MNCFQLLSWSALLVWTDSLADVPKVIFDPGNWAIYNSQLRVQIFSLFPFPRREQ